MFCLRSRYSSGKEKQNKTPYFLRYSWLSLPPPRRAMQRCGGGSSSPRGAWRSPLAGGRVGGALRGCSLALLREGILTKDST